MLKVLVVKTVVKLREIVIFALMNVVAMAPAHLGSVSVTLGGVAKDVISKSKSPAQKIVTNKACVITMVNVTVTLGWEGETVQLLCLAQKDAHFTVFASMDAVSASLDTLA